MSNTLEELGKEIIADKQKEAQELEAKKLSEQQAQPNTPIDYDDIDDETFRKIAEKKGISFKKEDTETEEQKNKRLKDEENDFYSFAITKANLKPEDLAKPNLVKEKADNDLVYEDFRAKQLETSKNLSEAIIKKRFDKIYGIEEFNADEEDDDYNTQKEEYELDKEWKESLLKLRAEKLRGKVEKPILNAKEEYKRFKDNQKISYQANEKIDNFANKLTSEYIYTSDEFGDLPIKIENFDSYKKQLVDDLRQTALIVLHNNPNGNLDVIDGLAKDRIYADHRKQIEAAIKSRAYNEGVLEGKRPFKNPITEPVNTGVEQSDVQKKIEKIINAAQSKRV